MPQPYDRSLSLRLDALILQLEAGPPIIQKFALRLCKRYYERTVPGYGKRGR